MKTYALLIAFFCFTGIGFSQDIIVTADSSRVKCKINRKDADNFYFTIRKNQQDIKSYVAKSQVAYVLYATPGDEENTFPLRDLIVKKDSSRFYCQLYREDAGSYYARSINSNNYFDDQTFQKDEVAYVIRNSVPTTEVLATSKKINAGKRLYRSALTVGVLQGGGSLIGFDFEARIANNLGVQFGAGLLGFGLGFNSHFRQDIRSSFVSFQYWNQGLGNTHTQSIAGVTYVFRGKKWFTFQIGGGIPVKFGPAATEALRNNKFLLMYSIGAYFPY